MGLRVASSPGGNPGAISNIMRSGEQTGPEGMITTTVTMNNHRIQACPVWIPRALRITNIGLNIGTAGTAGAAIELGIYFDDGTGKPGNLLLDAGSINGTVTGIGLITVSQNLPAGLLWVAANLFGTPVTAPVCSAMGIYGRMQPNGANYQQAWQCNNAVDGALLAPFGPASRIATPPAVLLVAA